MATTVPYTGDLSVAPEDRPIPSRSADAPLSAFGGASAAAESHLGSQLEKSGTELWDRAIAMQQLHEQNDALAKASATVNKTADLELDFRSKEGQAAVDAYGAFKANVNQAIEDGSKDLKSDYARKLYLEQTRTNQQRALMGAGIHAGDQLKKATSGTSEAMRLSAVRAASSTPEDDAAYKSALEETRRTAETQASIYSWTTQPDGTNPQKDAFISHGNAELVDARARSLGPTKPLKAMALLDQAVKNGDVTEADISKTREWVQSHINNVTIRVEGANLITGADNRYGQEKVDREAMLPSIRGIETNTDGDYRHIHADVTHKVNNVTITEHGLGAYGIMQSNLQSWLKEAGMAAMTEQEFLNNPKAQDDLAWFKLNQFQNKPGGNANRAAMEWFTGSPDPDPNRNDATPGRKGTTAARYLSMFNGHLAVSQGITGIHEAAAARAEELAPDNAEFRVRLQQHTGALYSLQRAEEREHDWQIEQTLAGGIAMAKDGKLKTSWEETSPETQEAYHNANQTVQRKYDAILAQNAKGDYGATPENQALFRQYFGLLTNDNPSDDERNEVMGKNFLEEKMPMIQREQLQKLQVGLVNRTARNPPIGAALATVGAQLEKMGITPRLDREGFLQYKGALAMALGQRIQDNPNKPIGQEEMKTMALGLLRDYTYHKSTLLPIFDSSDKLFKVPVDEKQDLEITERYTKQYGRPPSDDEKQAIHSLMLLKQLESKKPDEAASAVDLKAPTLRGKGGRSYTPYIPPDKK